VTARAPRRSPCTAASAPGAGRNRSPPADRPASPGTSGCGLLWPDLPLVATRIGDEGHVRASSACVIEEIAPVVLVGDILAAQVRPAENRSLLTFLVRHHKQVARMGDA